MRAYVNEIIEKGEPWVDADFPPEEASFFDRAIDKEADYAKFSDYEWKRASEIYENPQVFEGGIDSN